MGSNDLGLWAGSQRLKTLARHFHQRKQTVAAAEVAFTKRAAVLICLFRGEDGNLRVIFTKRASTLSSYSGEVSLPGGKMEEGDADYVDTALREAKEEIGLDPRQVNVVTVLQPFIAKSDVLVVPVIGILSDRKAFNPTPNTAEVEALFDAPLQMFLKVLFHPVPLLAYFSLGLFPISINLISKQFPLAAGVLICVASIVFDTTTSFYGAEPIFRTLKICR
ncbi:Dihydroneopterin triphosphate diphosphatase [Parasponia andersonii]|uniref:Dihydroneopterin triphosphate diphosphatase n=1 Tax=Parasponia andersonii TaxID=3476 RepID=A0A2P5DX85_PARAD|nr:Dihydroneopterin triphosphate diphosphatase [Parasponia andersonii]